jgi:hypothetical protein
MKLFKALLVVGCALAFLTGTTLAADKTATTNTTGKAVLKLTCCQQTAAKGKDCRMKCCVAAHRQGKSCEICNPNQEDLKLKKSATASPKAAAK